MSSTTYPKLKQLSWFLNITHSFALALHSTYQPRRFGSPTTAAFPQLWQAGESAGGFVTSTIWGLPPPLPDPGDSDIVSVGWGLRLG